MHPELLFQIGNLIVLPAWILLLTLPGNRYTRILVHSGLWSALLGIGYTALLLSRIGRVSGGFGSLAQVSLLFMDPWTLLAGWIHYLAFDLFVGAWIVRDARERAVPRILWSLCLLPAFLFGPVGLCLYLGIRNLLSLRSANRAV